MIQEGFCWDHQGFWARYPDVWMQTRDYSARTLSRQKLGMIVEWRVSLGVMKIDIRWDGWQLDDTDVVLADSVLWLCYSSLGFGCLYGCPHIWHRERVLLVVLWDSCGWIGAWCGSRNVAQNPLQYNTALGPANLVMIHLLQQFHIYFGTTEGIFWVLGLDMSGDCEVVCRLFVAVPPSHILHIFSL